LDLHPLLQRLNWQKLFFCNEERYYFFFHRNLEWEFLKYMSFSGIHHIFPFNFHIISSIDWALCIQLSERRYQFTLIILSWKYKKLWPVVRSKSAGQFRFTINVVLLSRVILSYSNTYVYFRYVCVFHESIRRIQQLIANRQS